MQIIECPHCGTENWVTNPEEEELTCELCDGYLEGDFSEEDEEE